MNSRTLAAALLMLSSSAFAAEPVNSAVVAAGLTKGTIVTIGLGVVAVGAGVAIASNDSNGGGTSGTTGTNVPR